MHELSHGTSQPASDYVEKPSSMHETSTLSSTMHRCIGKVTIQSVRCTAIVAELQSLLSDSFAENAVRRLGQPCYTGHASWQPCVIIRRIFIARWVRCCCMGCRGREQPLL